MILDHLWSLGFREWCAQRIDRGTVISSKPIHLVDEVDGFVFGLTMID